MNAELLLEHYERIAEAPDAIRRLRRFVLDLAMRGKLVEQDPNDEPASALLKQIEEDKVRLEAAGHVRRSKSIGHVTANKSFEIPSHWEWCSLQSLTRARMGKTILSKELCETGIPVFSAGMENKPWGYIESSDLSFQRGTVVISARGGIGFPKRPDFDQFISTQTTIACEPYDARVAPFVCLALDCLPDWKGMTSQTAIPMITVKQVNAIQIPLPPLAEQNRIVAKVDELMALCDQLEAAQADREIGRDKLTLSILAKLNEPDPETFADDARFALEHLDQLTKRTDQIKQLRQTILNLAVRGKLVEQDGADEPASAQAREIFLEREELVRKKLLRREKPLEPVREDEPPFEIPAGWLWSRIGDAVLFTQYGTSEKAHPSERGVPVLTMGNIQDGTVRWGREKRIPETSDELPSLYLQRFDLLYNRTNSAELVGKTGIYLGEDDCRTFASYL